VHATVQAHNSKGASEISEAGSGGVMIAVPEKPISLAENLSLRTATTLGLIWSDGLDDGSLPVIDYRVTVKTQAGDNVVTASSLLTRQYTANSLSLGV
jgi:hypothetical protein